MTSMAVRLRSWWTPSHESPRDALASRTRGDRAEPSRPPGEPPSHLGEQEIDLCAVQDQLLSYAAEWRIRLRQPASLGSMGGMRAIPMLKLESAANGFPHSARQKRTR